ncbi:uncharacterized protein K02A2.6-like [Ischnura elegans]|uniref:uncharacterized protein K02A2.6-like n=1 Tax=Ischnura elegans TaxID=197161 RepID=UPI001ED8A521|nr:uncharacterized protein K02A2.6-like [Ischnura elegans]
MISVSGVNHLSNFDSLPREIADFHHVFSPGLGKYSGPPARIHLKNDAKPVFKKARPVPFALLPRVDKELDNLVNEGILVPVKVSEWATPVVNVLKRDGTIRICGDYSCTVNPNCLRDVYPLPTIDELLAKLAGGKFFARFDLSLAFLQLTVDPETAKLLTLNTHKGLFEVHRLSQGLSASPGIFQRTMETLLAGLKGVVVYLDDILVQASSKEELWQRVREALSRISTAGLRLRPEKCQFGVTSIQFVGYLINGHGIFPTNEKFISQAWSPSRDVEERSSWDWRGELPPLILDEVPEPTVVNGSPSTAPSPETETDEDTRPEAQVAVDNSPGQDNRPRRMTKQPPYLKDYFVN